MIAQECVRVDNEISHVRKCSRDDVGNVSVHFNKATGHKCTDAFDSLSPLIPHTHNDVTNRIKMPFHKT